MKQGRATAGSRARSSQRGGAKAEGRRPRSQAPSALAIDGTSAEIRELIELQREAGNQAVTYLIEAPTLQRQDDDGGRRLPADVDVGFNPIDRAHNLVRAIDQSDVKVTSAPGFSLSTAMAGIDKRMFKRNVDFPAVVQALDGLTQAQVALVDAEYRKYEKKRSLDHDLLGSGQSGFPADLTH